MSKIGMTEEDYERRLDKLRAENERLRKVLEWYADRANWYQGVAVHAEEINEAGDCRTYSDCGGLARAVLKIDAATRTRRL